MKIKKITKLLEKQLLSSKKELKTQIYKVLKHDISLPVELIDDFHKDAQIMI